MMKLKLRLKEWLRKRRWNAELQISHMRTIMLQDNRWLASSDVARELTERYLKLLADDWETIPEEEISTFRSRICLDPRDTHSATLRWMPISTAPKLDGPRNTLLLGFENTGDTGDTGDGAWPSCQGYWSLMLNDWVVASPFSPTYAKLSDMTDYTPTHWMTVPELP